ERELADRLQHAVTRGGLVQRQDEHEALADQRADRLDRIEVVRTTLDEYLRRLEGESAGEHAELAKQALLDRLHQVIAPGDRRAQRLLPFGQVPRAAGQQRQAVLQPREQARRREHRQAGGRELERQRQPVQAAAYLGYGGCVGFGQLEAGLGVVSAGDEEGDRRHGSERVQIDASAPLRQRERGDSDYFLAADAQRPTAGRQHLEPGRQLQDLLGERCRR